MKLGAITLQDAPWAELVERWRYLEELGVETIWVADHLGGKWLEPGQHWYEAWSCITALAYETANARIGPLVSPMTFRNPAVLARTAATASDISGGRLELGVGSGASEWDHEVTGVPVWTPKERAAEFAGWLERLVELLADPLFHSEHRISLTIAGRGKTILGLSARFADRWNSFGGFGITAEEALRRGRVDNEHLDELCAESGRTVLRSALIGFPFVGEAPFESDDAFADVVGRYGDAGFEELVFYYPVDWKTPPERVRAGVFERALAKG